MELRQPEKGYRYNTDSILLYRFASQKRLRGSILDAGCGCGIVGLLLARDFGLRLVGVDIQEEMVTFATQNGAINNIDARFFAADFRGFDIGEKFDAIVCNPPFYDASATASVDPSLKLARYDSALPIEDFLRQAGKLLKSDGDLFFCYDAARSAKALKTLNDARWRIRSIQFAHKESRSNARLIFIRAKKTPIKALEVLPPFILRDETGASVDVRSIAKQAGTLCAA
ncbi:MAG: methyltransferase [Helicobacteraceae bacterium]|jgi:tRNA1(Val) A37 N6-methylase TrmN6|nr:methyltransferase [Helicobacteraceae bacterium]